MTARKPKPRKAAPRKGSRATLEQRVSDLERLADWNSDCITVLRNELETLQTRKEFRDASHDEPVSNAGEAVGQHFRILGESRRWARPLRLLIRWMDGL